MLLLVVGPTGAGKDTLLAAARRYFTGRSGFLFVRRVCTRPPVIGGDDDFEAVDEKTFLARRDAGAFAAWWRSNGFYYGVPAEIHLALAQERTVVANVARTVVGELATRYPVAVIEVLAPADQLARRLAALGRGDAVDAARRLARPGPLPTNVPRECVMNDGSVEQGAKRFIAALNRLAEAVPAL